jgi:hypothetical protein
VPKVYENFNYRGRCGFAGFRGSALRWGLPSGLRWPWPVVDSLWAVGCGLWLWTAGVRGRQSPIARVGEQRGKGATRGNALVNNISARKKSRREVGGPAQRLQAAVEQLLTGEHSTPTLDFFRAISAGECLVVSIVTLCGAKLNSLTPLGSVVLPLLKVTM